MSSSDRPRWIRAASSLLQWLGVFAFTSVLGEGIARLGFGIRPLTNESLVGKLR